MPTMMIPSPEEISNMISYCHLSGNLTWKPRSPSKGVSVGSAKSFNTQFSGKHAMHYIGDQGYAVGKLMGKLYKSHRIAWVLHYGEWPKGEIDHINHNKIDNRISNLRDVTHAENMKNSLVKSNNTSGVFGVHWNNDYSKWAAVIQHNGRPIKLGVFDDINDAALARKAALIKYGYSELHGSH